MSIPVGLLTCVTGVSGSGKSSLISSTLYPAAASQLNRATSLSAVECSSITGFDVLDKVVDINRHNYKGKISRDAEMIKELMSQKVDFDFLVALLI